LQIAVAKAALRGGCGHAFLIGILMNGPLTQAQQAIAGVSYSVSGSLQSDEFFP
jgi:hypothetical protein